MTIWLTKFAHLTAISIWAAGLIALPFVLGQRRGLEGEDLYRLQRLVRFLYVALVSPAAFLAIGSGIALIFLRATFVEWFTLKLAFVGVLAVLHVTIGLLVLRVFERDGRLGTGGRTTLTGAVLGAVGAILWLVLAKPDLDAGSIAAGLFAPGALGALVEPLISRATP